MEATQHSVLPQDFLDEPAPNIQVSRIDFAKTALPIYTGSYAVILDDVLSPQECQTLIQAAEATAPQGWERAMVNIGGGKQRLMEDMRNCGRIIWDSRDVVARIWRRIERLAEIQEIVRLSGVPHITGNGPAQRGEVWKFSRPNERMRFLKYVGGEYFRPHCDGCYETPDGTERSYFTLHLYLNNSEQPPKTNLHAPTPHAQEQAAQSPLVGGATTFLSYASSGALDVQPRKGRVLIFQHRGLRHSGEDVVQGEKYTMRTDLMYALQSDEAGVGRPSGGVSAFARNIISSIPSFSR